MTVADAGLLEVAKLTGQGLGGTKFDHMAIGSGSTPPAAGQTALVAEHTTNGGARQGSAAQPLQTKNFADDTMRWRKSWALSGELTVREFAVFNAASAGAMLLRQTFASDLFLVQGDSVELTVDVVVTGPTDVPQSSPGNPRPAKVLTRAGIVKGNKLVSAAYADADRFGHIALGSDTGATLQVLSSNTALGSEFTNLGLVRVAATVAAPPTAGVPANTTRWSGTWTATGTASVNEVGVFNAATNGTMLLRHVFANPLNLVNTDSFTMTVDLTNTG